MGLPRALTILAFALLGHGGEVRADVMQANCKVELKAYCPALSGLAARQCLAKKRDKLGRKCIDYLEPCFLDKKEYCAQSESEPDKIECLLKNAGHLSDLCRKKLSAQCWRDRVKYCGKFAAVDPKANECYKKNFSKFIPRCQRYLKPGIEAYAKLKKKQPPAASKEPPKKR